jgi:hypothetical protein
VTVIHEGL